MFLQGCKKVLGVLLLGTSLAGAANDVNAIVEAAEPSDPNALVDIPDAVLRRALEEELGKQEDEPITRSDMARLNYFEVDGGVDQLTGLEHAINLRSLSSTNGEISDLTPLAELKSLTSLNLIGNAIRDIAPLAELHALTGLYLSGNGISDIAPLAGLHALTWLYLGHNANVSPRLLFGNAVSDVAPLAALDALTVLNLAGNVVSDIAPLVANDGLDSGDTLNLEGNPLSARAIDTDLPKLQERGVEVTFDSRALAEGDRPADIPDPAMRAIFEKALNKWAGWPIGVKEIAEVTKLDARDFWRREPSRP